LVSEVFAEDGELSSAVLVMGVARARGRGRGYGGGAPGTTPHDRVAASKVPSKDSEL